MLSPMATTIQALNRKPSRGSADYDRWVQHDDLITLIKQQQTGDDIILYASFAHLFLYSVLVPNTAIQPIDKEDILQWNCSPSDGWRWTYWNEDGATHHAIETSMQSCGSATIAQGEQIVFARDFDGHRDQRHYFELSQKVAQLIDVHHVPSRQSYCRLDEHGDIEDVVRMIQFDNNSLITIKRSELDVLLDMTCSALVLMFDSTRFEPGAFGGWKQAEEISVELAEDHIFYRGQTNPGKESYRRGFAVIRARKSRRKLPWEPADPKQYATFITQDWKNDRVVEWTCDPDKLGNYFSVSELPYFTSPTFFRPEVLQKYKADTDKYRIEPRQIHCRGTWSLTTYDINEAGQVHTYVGYLGNLPFTEQLYWKAFNEAPKAAISSRALKTDFLAEFDLAYDPLVGLKSILERQIERCSPWWQLKDEKAMQHTLYPYTDSQDEWANEIMALDQLVVEGLSRAYLKAKSGSLSIKVDSQWQSIKLIGEILSAQNVNTEEINAIVTPLRSLHDLRSKMKGHSGGSEAKQIREQIIATHGNFKAHYRKLVSDCEHAIKLLNEFHEDGVI